MDGVDGGEAREDEGGAGGEGGDGVGGGGEEGADGGDEVDAAVEEEAALVLGGLAPWGMSANVNLTGGGGVW